MINITITVYDKRVELGPYKLVKVDGCSLWGDDTRIVEFTTYDEGYCETCSYVKSGVELVASALILGVTGSTRPSYYETRIAAAHVKIIIEDSTNDY